jgi:hypothetical protein
MAIRTVQITDISFDCSLEDDDWTEQDQLVTEEDLPKEYIGSVWELEVDDDDVDDAHLVEELLEEVSSATGWCINSIDFRYVLK